MASTLKLQRENQYWQKRIRRLVSHLPKDILMNYSVDWLNKSCIFPRFKSLNRCWMAQRKVVALSTTTVVYSTYMLIYLVLSSIVVCMILFYDSKQKWFVWSGYFMLTLTCWHKCGTSGIGAGFLRLDNVIITDSWHKTKPEECFHCSDTKLSSFTPITPTHYSALVRTYLSHLRYLTIAEVFLSTVGDLTLLWHTILQQLSKTF